MRKFLVIYGSDKYGPESAEEVRGVKALRALKRDEQSYRSELNDDGAYIMIYEGVVGSGDLEFIEKV